MTNVYNFVGVVSNVGDVEFNAIGQTVELTDKGFAEVLAGGASFLPEAEFAAEFEGFDPVELRRYADPWFFGERPQDFVRRVEACREKVRQLRANQ